MGLADAGGCAWEWKERPWVRLPLPLGQGFSLGSVSLAGWGSAQAFPVAVNLSALRPPPGLPVAVGELVSGLWTT